MNVGVFNGLVVWVEQCALGVDGVEVAAGAHGSKFNDAVIALFKAGGFGVNDGKTGSLGLRGVWQLRRFTKSPWP